LHYYSLHSGQFGKYVTHLQQCVSTNDYAKKIIRDKSANNGQIVISDFQTSGRGRSGNTWQADPASNFLMSLILLGQKLPVKRQFYLNLVFSLAIKRFLARFVKDEFLKVKWPNDIYFGNYKIAGILIENYINATINDQSIIGMGININQTNFGDLKATSLSKITRMPFNLFELFPMLVEELEKFSQLLVNGHFIEIKDLYEEGLFGRNELRSFNSGTTWKGIIKGIDDEGQLLIEKNGRLCAFYLNELQFVI
jgi:BirA family biotin operon repressor/biotin-[acetyl-CoA-carboxylase] ligase